MLFWNILPFFRVMTAILLLGNVEFVEADGLGKPLYSLQRTKADELSQIFCIELKVMSNEKWTWMWYDSKGSLNCLRLSIKLFFDNCCS
jgi:hypothetical protein